MNVITLTFFYNEVITFGLLCFYFFFYLCSFFWKSLKYNSSFRQIHREETDRHVIFNIQSSRWIIFLFDNRRNWFLVWFKILLDSAKSKPWRQNVKTPILFPADREDEPPPHKKLRPSKYNTKVHMVCFI